MSAARAASDQIVAQVDEVKTEINELYTIQKCPLHAALDDVEVRWGPVVIWSALLSRSSALVWADNFFVASSRWGAVLALGSTISVSSVEAVTNEFVEAPPTERPLAAGPEQRRGTLVVFGSRVRHLRVHYHYGCPLPQRGGATTSPGANDGRYLAQNTAGPPVSICCRVFPLRCSGVGIGPSPSRSFRGSGAPVPVASATVVWCTGFG